MRHLGKMAKWSAFILLLFSVSTTLQAQFTEGTIVGNVTDSSGAVVAGAAVQVTNVQTAIS